MATYTYVIIDDAGKQKKGSINGDSREKVMDKLKKNGATIVSLNDAGALNRDIEISFLQPKPKPRDMAVFCRQFVSIVSAGVPVLSALEMLSEQTENKKLAAAVDKCRSSIERGETLAQSMAESPDIFPSMFITMVEAGEASGSLETSFTRMAEQYEKTAKLRATVRKATTYPIVILVIAAIAVGILLTKVVPTFEDMLNDLGIPLPGITKFVIAASSFLQEWWYIVIAVGVLIVLGLRVFKGSETGAHLLGKLALKLPIFGKLTYKTASARMARTLSTLLVSGLPLIQALEITANTMTNVFFKEELLAARDAVAMGSNLSEPLAEGGLFPPLLHHMLSIGEETGAIENMLDKLAEYYEDEVKQATEQVMAAIEPLIILLLAGVIGTIVLAVIMPMASMYSGLQNL